MSNLYQWACWKIFQLGWWIVQRFKPKTFGVWTPIPEGHTFSIIHKVPTAGTVDPLDTLETIGIKVKRLQPWSIPEGMKGPITQQTASSVKERSRNGNSAA